MSVSSAKTYILTLPKAEVSGVVDQLLAQEFKLEFLDPRDLGTEWSKISFYQAEKIQPHPLMTKLEKVLSVYESKGPFSFLVDYRVRASYAELVAVREKMVELEGIVEDLYCYSKLKKAQIDYQKLTKENPDQFALIGTNLEDIEDGIHDFSKKIIHDFQNYHPHEQLEVDIPIVDTVHLGDLYQVIFTTPEDEHFIRDYIRVQNIDTKLWNREEFDQYITTKVNQLRLSLANLGFDPEKLPAGKFAYLATLHAALELETKASHAKHEVFTVTEGGEGYFAIIAVAPQDATSLHNYLNQNKIPFEETSWPQEIVVWKHSGGWKAFQGIAESLGTIDSKESDPTGFIGFFFALFFAFCLGDALYGLIITLFCGYFLYFRRLKPQFESIFNLFFYSGLATIIFGAVTNSWAGDLFVNTPLKSGFESLQLINPLDPNAQVPVNMWLKENGGLSPIVALMGVSLLIGLINIYSAYFLKFQTLIRSQDWSGFRNELSWFGFVTSLLATVVVTSVVPAYTLVSLGGLGLFTLSLFIFNNGEGIVSKVLSGLVSIYNLISFFADILSFTRLVAVGLTSGIVANVINLLAGLILVSIPVPGVNIVIAALVLLGGHVFNLAVALFGAYINPLRLHYVEFMPKFYEGRGRSLDPVQADLTYFKLGEEHSN